MFSLSPNTQTASTSFFKRKGKRQNRVNKLQEKNEAISEINRHRPADVIYMSLTCLPISTIKIVLPNVHSMTKIIYDQLTHRFGNKMCFIFYHRHISHIFFTLLLFCPEKEILVDFAAHLSNKSRTIPTSLSLSDAPALG